MFYGKQGSNKRGSRRRRGIGEGMLNLAMPEVNREQYGDGAVFPCLISRESRGGQAGRGCDPVWRLRGSLSWWRLACLGVIHKSEVSLGPAAQVEKNKNIKIQATSEPDYHLVCVKTGEMWELHSKQD